MKHKKTGKYFPMKDTGHVTEKLTFIFSTFWIFHRFSINIRTDVHFCLFALGNERILVACKSLRIASRFTKFIRDQCPFISQCKQNKYVFFNPEVILSVLIIHGVRICLHVPTVFHHA